VLGADTYKRSRTVAAVAPATGELLGEQTVQVGRRGFGALLRWARGVDGDRVWALEDCRHVSGSLERFLIERGERVVRIPTHLTARARKSARQRGESDPIDALNVARAALQEGLDAFPAAQLEGPELDLRLLVDHRERLVRQRVELDSTLLWHLHDLWPDLRPPGGALFSKKWSTRIGRRLHRAQQTMRVRIARDELRRLRELTLAVNGLEREITGLVQQFAPQLLSEPGFGPLIAAKLVGEIAGATASPHRPSTPARPVSRRSPPARATRNATDSPRAATATSTRRCTARSSPAPAVTRRPATTSPADAPRARAPAKRSAASSATSPAASGDCSSRQPAPTTSTHQFLDIEATFA
jgi:transposase